MRRITWSNAAIDELGAADDYFRSVNAAFAERLNEDVLGAASFLASAPFVGQNIGEGQRKWRVAGTPYLILYRPFARSIRILHVVHAARDWTRFL